MHVCMYTCTYTHLISPQHPLHLPHHGLRRVLHLALCPHAGRRPLRDPRGGVPDRARGRHHRDVDDAFRRRQSARCSLVHQAARREARTAHPDLLAGRQARGSELGRHDGRE